MNIIGSLTKRDYFAAAALNALIGRHQGQIDADAMCGVLPALAYKLADAMIAMDVATANNGFEDKKPRA